MTDTSLALPQRTRRPWGPWSMLIAVVAASLSTVGAGLVSGCDDRGAAVVAPAEPDSPLPEQRFERIVEDLKESLRVDDRAPRRVPGGPGGASLEWSYRLEDKLIEPQTNEENYRGVITITTESTTTLFSRSDEEGEDDGESDQGSSQSRSSSSPSGDEEEAAPTDSTSGGGEEGAPLGMRSPITRHESEDFERFELEYVDDRWRLLTPPEEDSALETMFQHALDLQ